MSSPAESLLRIADALERIAFALEHASGMPPVPPSPPPRVLPDPAIGIRREPANKPGRPLGWGWA